MQINVIKNRSFATILLATMLFGLPGLSATALAQPALTLNSIDQLPASVPPGQSDTTGIMSVTNSGSVTLTITGVSITSPEGALSTGFLTGGSVQVDPGGSANLDITVRYSLTATPGQATLRGQAFGFVNSGGSFPANFTTGLATFTVTAPVIDLLLDSVVVDTGPLPVDQTLPVTYVTRYDAPSANFQNPSFRVEFYLSSDGSLDTQTDFSLGSRSSSQNPQTATTRTVAFAIPSAVPIGSYFVLGNMDSNTQIPEANENNQVLASTNQVTLTTPSFDLVMVSVTPLVSTTSAASVLPLTFVVDHVTGNPQGPTKFPAIKLYLSTSSTFLDVNTALLIDTAFPTMTAQQQTGQQRSPNLQATLAPRTYFLGAVLDQPSSGSPNGAIREANENNNVILNPSGVAVLANPLDLRLLSLSSLVPTTAAFSTLPVTFTAIYDGPPGQFQNVSYSVKLSLSRDQVPSSDDVDLVVPSVSNHAVRTTIGQQSNGTVPSTLEPGSYFILGKIDQSESVPEVNEDNNELASAGTVSILANPTDLQVLSLSSLTATTSVTQSVQVTYVARYSVPAGEFPQISTRIQFFYSRDGVKDDGDLLINNATAVRNYQPNETFGESRTFFAPQLVAPGSNFIIAVISPNSSSDTDGNRGNNITVSSNQIVLFRPPDDHPNFPQNTRDPQENLVYGVERLGNIDFPGDVDAYRFQASAGTLVHARFRSLASRNFKFEVLDQDGSRILGDVTTSGTANENFINILTSGTYFVRVQDSNGANDFGGYGITLTQSRVDIRPVSLAVPSVVSVNGSIGLTLAIQLDAQPGIPAPLNNAELRFYLSEFASLDPALAIRLGDRTVNLSTGSPVVVTPALDLRTASPKVEPGFYFLFARVDHQNCVAETNLTNNEIRSVGLIQVAASTLDARIVNFQAGLSTVSPDSLLPTTYAVTVVDSSGGQGTFNSRVKFYLSQDSILDRSSDTPLDGPNQEHVIGQVRGQLVNISIPRKVKAGTYSLFLEIDTDNAISETDEANNVIGLRPITVTTPAFDIRMISVTPSVTVTSVNSSMPVTASIGYSTPTSLFVDQFLKAEIFLSRDNILSSDDESPGSLFSSTVEPNETVTVSSTLNFSSTIQPGVYRMFAKARPQSGTARVDANPGNDVLLFPSPITLTAPVIDHQITAFTSPITATGPLQTVPTTITFRIVDSDPSRSGTFQSYRIDGFLSEDGVLDTFRDTPLSGGLSLSALVNQDQTLNPNFLIPARTVAGSYTLFVIADRSNQVNEADENNNVRSIPITIGAPVVDLIADAVVSLNPSLSVGDTVALSVTARFVAPSGVGSLSSVEVQGYLSQDRTLETFRDPSLGRASFNIDPGQVQKTVELPIPAAVSPGAYFFIGELDPRKLIPEIDETNNVAVSSAAVGIAPAQTDLSLLAFEATRGTFSPGEALPITATFKYTAPSTAFPSRSGISIAAYLSNDTTLDLEVDRAVGTGTYFTSVKPGETAYLAFDAGHLRALPSGQYWLIGVLDPNQSFADGDRSNNIRVASRTTAFGPSLIDLSVGSLTQSVSSVAQEQPVTLTFELAYDAPDPKTRFKNLFVSTEILMLQQRQFDKYEFFPLSTVNQSVEPGQRVTETRTINPGNFANPGTYFLAVAVDRTGTGNPGSSAVFGDAFVAGAADRTNTVAETSETNNLFISSSSLTITTSFDELIDLSISPFAVATSTVAAGFSVSVPYSITATGLPSGPSGTISNRAVTFFSIRYSLADSGATTDTGAAFLNSQFISSSSLGSGETSTGILGVTIPRSQAPGTYRLIQQVQENVTGVTDPNRSNDVQISNNILTVTAPSSNQPPEVDAGPDRIVAAERKVSFFATASDPDGDSFTKQWSQVSGPSVESLAIETQQTMRVSLPSVGLYTFRLTATDAFSATTFDDVLVDARDKDSLGPIIDTAVGAMSRQNSFGEATPADATFLGSGDSLEDVAIDSLGRLYFLEGNFNSRVRRVDTDGRVRTVAGPPIGTSSNNKTAVQNQNSSGNAGFSGDGGPATSAKFGAPEGISIGSNNNLLIADTKNHRIREVLLATGNVNTIAGGAHEQDNPFCFGTFSGDGGLATQAGLNEPHDVLQAANGTIYIADTGNHRIRRIRSGTIDTIAGTGFPGSTGDGQVAVGATLNDPTRLAFDRDGNLLILDEGSRKVRKVNAQTGVISTVAGTGAKGSTGDGGPATAALFNELAGIEFDSARFGYASDEVVHRIRQIDPSGDISNLAGTGQQGYSGDAGPAGLAKLNEPAALAVDGQRNLFFIDSKNLRVRVVGAAATASAQPPAIVLTPDDALGGFSVDNDRDAQSTGVQAAIIIAGIPSTLADGTAVTLQVLDGSNVVSTHNGTIQNQAVNFDDVTLLPGTTYTLVLTNSTTGDTLARIALTEGRTPVATVRLVGQNLGGPQLVRLDGSSSADPDAGDTLTYQWSFVTQPPGSASFSSTESVTTYRATQAGLYVFRLTVTDPTSRSSTADAQVRITNVAPIPETGPDRQFLLPNPVSGLPADRTTDAITLDARGSRDANGDPITYQWELLEKPTASTRTSGNLFSAPTSAQTRIQFSTDKDTEGFIKDSGLYVLRLTVSDSLGQSRNKLLRIVALDPVNIMPNANAGIDRAVAVTVVQTSPTVTIQADVPDVLGTRQAFIRLDGRESSDSPRPNGLPRPLTYQWTLASAPSGSAATALLNLADTALPTFVPDRPGVFSFDLVVDNGKFQSQPSRVNIAVSIRNDNAPPTADFRIRDATGGRVSSLATPVLTFTVDDVITLDGSFSFDPEDVGQITYAWTQLSGEPVALAPSDTDGQPSFQATTGGLYNFELVVTDPDGASSRPSRGSAIVVEAGNTVPRLSLEATAPSTTTGEDFGEDFREGKPNSLVVTTLTTVTLTATAIDPEVTAGSQLLSYVFTQIAGPTVALTTGTENTSSLVSQVQFTPTTSRVHVFEGRLVELNADGTATGVEVVRFIRVRVDSSVNGVPIAEATVLTGKTNVGICETIRLDGSGSFDQGQNATGTVQYRWEQVAGPTVVFSDPFSSQTTFVAPDFGQDDERELIFSLLVDDGNDQSEPDLLSINLDPSSTQSISLDLIRGLDLIAVPVTPRTTPAYTAQDLAQATGSPVVIRVAAGEDGNMSFTVWHAGLGIPPFEIQGNEGYLISRQKPGASLPFIGRAWQSSGLFRELDKGTNIVAYPRGAPSREDAATLAERSGSTYIARYNPTEGKFDVYLPGLTPQAFPIERGRAYLLSASSSRTLTLPTCGQ